MCCPTWCDSRKGVCDYEQTQKYGHRSTGSCVTSADERRAICAFAEHQHVQHARHDGGLSASSRQLHNALARLIRSAVATPVLIVTACP